jgi:signal peptidase I
MDQALKSGRKGKELRSDMSALEKAANKWLKPYPFPGWRENFEMFLVALAVAMAIRTFWIQPFKIPTGSMQPTLFGVTSEPNYAAPTWLGGDTNANFAIPTGWQRVKAWFGGVSFVDVTADTNGRYNGSRLWKVLIFNIRQVFYIGGKAHTVWFPPDGGGAPLGDRAGLEQHYPDGRVAVANRYFRKGEKVIHMRVVSGDHLFVNRVKYNFTRPKRGDIVVFETHGIQGLPQNQFYIKRLIGLGGETVQIGDDRHVIINRTNRLNASTPHFEFVYSFDPNKPPHDSEYSGHVNSATARRYGFDYEGHDIAPLFPNQSATFHVPKGQLMVFGDNTMNSKDSRVWGSFDERNVIGDASFVYWPITKRFGWAFR